MLRSSTRLMVYAAGRRGLGQTVRALRVAGYATTRAGPSSEALVVTGVPRADRLFRLPRCRILPLPELVALVACVRDQAADGSAAMRGAATAALNRLMDGIRPNVFITTSHRGVAGELVPVLSRAREYGCHTVLTLRDIYEPPRYTAEFEQLTEADFDSVVIAGPSAVQRWLPRGLVHGPLSRRVHFSGYFPPPTPIREVREAKPQALVLCQVGGGADGRVLLESVLTAIPDVRSSLSRDVQLRLVTGPLMSDADVEAVRARARGEASVQPWLWSPSGELGPDIGRPDLVVSMAGYNSCVEAAWSRAPSILMPRVDPEDREQEVRAALFAGWFRNIASVRTHSSDELAALMVHFLSSGRSVEHADRVIPSDMFARADEVTATVLGPRGTGTATRS